MVKTTDIKPAGSNVTHRSASLKPAKNATPQAGHPDWRPGALGASDGVLVCTSACLACQLPPPAPHPNHRPTTLQQPSQPPPTPTPAHLCQRRVFSAQALHLSSLRIQRRDQLVSAGLQCRHALVQQRRRPAAAHVALPWQRQQQRGSRGRGREAAGRGRPASWPGADAATSSTTTISSTSRSSISAGARAAAAACTRGASQPLLQLLHPLLGQHQLLCCPAALRLEGVQLAQQLCTQQAG